MAKNQNLHDAMAAKNDEFYTRREDIDNELRHYKHYFKDKIVLCNCDDPYESNFFKYFASNFNYLGLKKLICTCYDSSPVAGQQLELFPERNPYKIEITEVSDENGDGAVDLSDVEYLLKNKKNVLKRLKSGDFRSDECIEILKECDVVVTNPPFSLFREFVAQITNYKKDFVIIGNTNALTYKEIFKLFQADRIRTGYTNFNVGMYFYVPEAVEKYHKIENGRKMVRVSTSCWFTSLPVKKHTEDLILYQKYSPDIYQKYDNYDAININTYTDIPYDYEGEMGVPVTFLDKYNPDQFEILGMAASAGYKKEIVGIDFLGHKDARPLINGKNTYARVFIRKKR
ncbi:MAG: adenine-specific methyltransferase EcoRI family protein [Clostridia bacterium]|nr:adenine-specific methyltransferase EcoRI family protein [Clostridia bacterium]